jgi:SWIM zinc finger
MQPGSWGVLMVTSSFAEILTTEARALMAQFPDLATGLGKACAILREQRLFVEESGREAMVQSSDRQQWYAVNGHCTCKAAQYYEKPCQHRLALRLYQRVADALLVDDEARWEPDDDNPAFQPPAAVPALPADAILHIQGKPFVRFEGLLQLAHERGLVELTTTLVQCTLDMAICQATARFQDGRTFTDIGDASPENMAKHLRPHFVRMAATRASARALRRALNISAVAVEELGAEEVEA